MLWVKPMKLAYLGCRFLRQAVFERPPGSREPCGKIASDRLAPALGPLGLGPETRNELAHIVARELDLAVRHGYQHTVAGDGRRNLCVSALTEVNQVGAGG